MTLKEIYKLPDGSNVTLLFTPSFYDDKENFPCPSSMRKAFNGYSGYSIPMLDTSNVTDMYYMFSDCINLLGFNAENWDVSKVTNMGYMFYGSGKLKTLDLSTWDTSNVTNMDYAFNCNNLVSLSAIKSDSLLLSSSAKPFGTSNNTKLVDFGGFINLKSSWNGSYCADKLTALSHQSLINILNGLYDFTGNGEVPTSAQGKIKLGTTHLAKLSDDEKAIATSRGWVLS